MDDARKSKLSISMLFKELIVLLVFVAYMFPFFLVVINSLKHKAAVVLNPLSLFDPKGLTIQNFSNAFKDMNYLSAFGNSALITLSSVALIILLSSMAGYIFARTKWLASKLFFALMVASMVIPFQVIMIPLVSIYGNSLNLLNNRGTLIYMHVGFSVSLATFMFQGFVKGSIPIALEEAAKIDGCTKLQTFFLIVFPLLKPITSTIIILNVLAIWNDYLLPSLILGKKALLTLPLSTYTFYGTYSNDLGKIMAALLMTAFPIIIIYLFMQKYIISGVVSGAVKA